MDLDGIYVESHGAAGGRPIVLVHGAPDRSASFREAVARLGDRHVVVYDRRGYGRSLDAAPPTGMVDHAHDLLGVLDTLGEPAAVVAHSFGSNPTMLAATLRPEAFAALGVWEPPLVWTEPWPQVTKDYNVMVAEADDPGAMVEDFYRRALGNRMWEGQSPAARERRLAEAVAFQADMASEIATPFEFEDVLVSTLVGYGTETMGGHVEGAHWLAAALPDARVHGVEGAGHFAPRTHPDDFAAFVRAAAGTKARQ
jgi:pimeloyl-ACP methyl ester carboxylesterase